MKLLHINFVYPSGSTGKLVHSIHNYSIQQGCESFVLYGRGAVCSEPQTKKFCSNIESYAHTALVKLGLSLDYGGTPISTYKVLKFIKSYKPDIVHLHCLNGSCVNLYKLLSFLGEHKIKTVITHHAEFYYTGTCPHAFDCLQFTESPGCMNCTTPNSSTRSHKPGIAKRSWKEMAKAFQSFNTNDLYNIAVSPWVESRARISSILKIRNNITILNGVNTSIFCNRKNKDIFAKWVTANDRKIVLHVAAHFSTSKADNKGGFFILQLAEKNPDIDFFIVASRISKIDSTALPPNVHVIGRANHQEQLAQFYSNADLTIITSRRETFSLICAESLCCGTPVVGFEAGGPESIGIAEYSQFVEYGNLSALNEAIHNMLQKNVDKTTVSSQAHNKYSDERMNQQYFDLYKSILEK